LIQKQALLQCEIPPEAIQALGGESSPKFRWLALLFTQLVNDYEAQKQALFDGSNAPIRASIFIDYHRVSHCC
jgi:hypothetical protein